MNTVIVTSSNELMKASAQPLARHDQRKGDPLQDCPFRCAERHGGVFEGTVETDRRGQGQPQRERHHHDDVGQHEAGEGAAQADLGEEAQEGDAQHDVGNHQRRHEECRKGFAALEAVARDRECGRHGDRDRDRRGDRAEQETLPEGGDELRIARDGVEPAQRPAIGRERKIAFRREGDPDHHQDRRHHEDHEQRVEGEREGSVSAHPNTCA
jgi:hypothetical protein